MNLYEKRLEAEKTMSIGEVVRSRRSVDKVYDWHVNKVRWCECVHV